MQPTRTRLVCRAHNRFTPSIALWQHFVTPEPPFLHQHRLSSTAAELVEDGARAPSIHLNPRESSGLNRLEAELAMKEEPIVNIKRTHPVKIRRQKTDSNWKPTKVEASVFKNTRKQYEARQASMTEPERLLAQARVAFEDAQDYEGVVVKPMTNPQPVKESSLPWCLKKDEMTMAGVDRLGVEIERFYNYTKPNHLETLARRHVIEQVRDHVRMTLPEYVLEVFGSERTGIALATSDIDFRLMKKEQMEVLALTRLPPTPAQRSQAMRSLRLLYWNNLSKHKAYLLPQLRYARYPLISLQDRQSGLDAQIVLSNDTSVSRAIMQGYMEQYPYLRHLYYVIKTMFDVRGLSDVFRGGFGSYTLFMMVVASIRHKPHPRNDAAGALINFMKFYRDFPTTKQGISIEPVWLFDKGELTVMTDKAKAKLKEGTAKPLPAYMLCLRDPADETNDLGRKAISIKHVKATLKQLCVDLNRDMAINTRPSLLGPLVGTSYMLNRARRHKLQHYGHTLSQQLSQSLAAKAKAIRDRETSAKAVEESEEDRERARLTRDGRYQEWGNKKLGLEVKRTAVLEHRDAMSNILGMPSVEDDASREQHTKAEWETILDSRAEDTTHETGSHEKRTD